MEPSTIIALTIFLLIPFGAVALWLFGVILIGTFILVLIVFLVVFVLIPVIYKNSYGLQRNLLFLNVVSIPVDFKRPEKLGLFGSRNLYKETSDNITLGVWQILPLSQVSLLPPDFDKALSHGEPIFIYMHGNSGNRGSSHRVELYKILQRNNYHVIAFDYRSYGDSKMVEPSEEGVVEDSKTIYEWVKSLSGKAKIFLWGHSLGTGISSHLLEILEKEGGDIAGLVLESPFNNIRDEIRSYPLAKIFRYLPWFDYFFTDPMYQNGLKFESDKHLANVKAPIMILHAEDDIVIPIELGEQLYKTIENTRGNSSPVTFVKFNKSHGFGHKYIYKSSNLSDLVNNFVKTSLEFKKF